MAILSGTTIQQKRGNISTLSSLNSIFKDGEIIVVNLEDGSRKIKIGDGNTNFNDLPYLTNGELKKLELGVGSTANDYGIAAGWHAVQEDGANFATTLGAQVTTLSDDDFSFTWNGVNGEEYTSKGEGTFSINPKDGLSGVYVGDTTLADEIPEIKLNILGDTKKMDEFQVNYVTKPEYIRMLSDETVVSDQIYIVSSDYIDAYGMQIKNLSAGTLSSDAVTLGQFGSELEKNLTLANLSVILNDMYYTKTEVDDMITRVLTEEI